ncbi:MAG: Lrp/AsnC ligand binding domain-containing protein [Nitrosopumilaceae archaeon]
MIGKNVFVLITCDVGKNTAVKKRLEEMEQVKDVDATYGMYDLVAKIETSSTESFKKRFRKDIVKIPDIRSTLTLFLIDDEIKDT